MLQEVSSLQSFFFFVGSRPQVPSLTRDFPVITQLMPIPKMANNRIIAAKPVVTKSVDISILRPHPHHQYRRNHRLPLHLDSQLSLQV